MLCSILLVTLLNSQIEGLYCIWACLTPPPPLPLSIQYSVESSVASPLSQIGNRIGSQPASKQSVIWPNTL